MMRKYYSNGVLDDEKYVGLSVYAWSVLPDGTVDAPLKNADGTPNLGYLANEITAGEFATWQHRISNPDGVVSVDAATGARTYTGTYFTGMAAGIGVIDKATRKSLDEKINSAKEHYSKQQAEANRINFKRAQRDAIEFGEDHEAVFTSYNPMVSEDVKAILFADARASMTKKAK